MHCLLLLFFKSILDTHLITFYFFFHKSIFFIIFPPSMCIIVVIGALGVGSEEVHCDIFKRCQTHYDYCSDSRPPKLWVSAMDSFCFRHTIMLDMNPYLCKLSGMHFIQSIMNAVELLMVKM